MNRTDWNVGRVFGRAVFARYAAFAAVIGVATATGSMVLAEEATGVTPEKEVKQETPHVVQKVAMNLPENSHSVAMTAIHNRYRAQSGLSEQSVDPQLSNVAQRWAEHMASVGSMYHGAGEQIIAYSGGDTSYEAGFRTWLGSSPHRAWLCSRGDRCGFGYAMGRNGCAYYAGAFGSSSTSSTSSTSSSDSENSNQLASYSSSTRQSRFRLLRRR
jgi:uncharacterized protein YkwD